MREEHVNRMKIREETHKILKVYAEKLSTYPGEIKFDWTPFFDPIQDPAKNYTAKTKVPLLFRGAEVGNITVLAFRAGDGTGDESKYTLASSNLPEKYQLMDRPKGALPRSKEGVLIEYCGIIGTFEAQSLNDSSWGMPAPFLGSLELLTADTTSAPNTIKKGFDIGVDNEYLLEEFTRNRHGSKPQLQVTTKLADGVRIGDPHAICFANQYVFEESSRDLHNHLKRMVQVAFFYTIKEEDAEANRELIEVLNRSVKD